MLKMLTIKEASDFSGLSQGTVRRFITKGNYSGYVMAGTKYLINQDMFEAFLKGENNSALSHPEE